MLGGLPAARPGEPVDVDVHLGSLPEWGAAPAAADGILHRPPPDDTESMVREAAWVEGRPGLRLRYADGAVFCVRADAREVWGAWPAPLTIEDAAIYLLGPVLGYVLRRFGVLALHASAVVVRGRAVAFCGPSGMGKSTIAAAAAAAGDAALTDDVLALRERDGRTMAFPAADHFRVWDDSARTLVGDGVVLPLLTPNWEKRAFPTEALGYSVAREAVPLGALFVIGTREDGSAAPRAEPLRAVEAFVPLVANTCANYLLDSHTRAEEFSMLTLVLKRTPAWRLVPHADPERLPALLACVRDALTGEARA